VASNKLQEGQKRVEGTVDFGIPAGACQGSNLRLFSAFTI